MAVGALVEALGLLTVLWLWRGGELRLPVLGGVYAGKWGLVWIGQVLVYHMSIRRLSWRHSPEDMRRILRSSAPILGAALVFFVPLSAGVEESLRAT